jgi:hypothetical protein
MFDSVQIVRMHTLAWEFSKKDIIGGKEIQFLVIKIGSIRGLQALESQSAKTYILEHYSAEPARVVCKLPFSTCLWNSHSYLLK